MRTQKETRTQNRIDLSEMARQAMREKYLEPDFSREVLEQAQALTGAAEDVGARDLRASDWISIDREESLDLDQLSVAEDLGEGRVRVQIAIADVDALVPKDSAIDLHARYNTTSVYTVAETFPMLPKKLAHDLTSLRQDEDRLTVVVSYVVTADGNIETPEIFQAQVRNKAKLTYEGVTAWLEERSPLPEAFQGNSELAQQVRLQDDVTRRLRTRRQEQGALHLRPLKTQAAMRRGVVVGLSEIQQNRAEELIEDLMIAANGVTSQFLEQQGFPALRRVVRTPQNWEGIVRVAVQSRHSLPAVPDSRALAAFLDQRRESDPLHFPDLSLLIIRMLGPGEYVLHQPEEAAAGHFGLAVRDYTHSTAPNRRYPDLITQRLLKAALRGQPAPYSDGELEELAAHCTWKEDMADRVERHMLRSAAAILLSRRIGDRFKAVITSVTPKGVYVRVLRPPVEGMIGSRKRHVEAGEQVSVRLAGVDVEKGYLDFVL